MSARRAPAGGFEAWADALLAGTRWSAATVRAAAGADTPDLATAALAAGFAAAEYAAAATRRGDDVR